MSGAARRRSRSVSVFPRLWARSVSGGPDEDQAGSGRAAELKADVPQGERIPHSHRPAGCRQAHERGALAPEHCGEDEESAHQRGARDGGIASDQECVEDKAGEGRPQGCAPSEQFDAEGHEQAGD